MSNPNKSPACGKYVNGRKNLNGDWINSENGSNDYVIVGGDDSLNCVGVDGTRCHVPLTISITCKQENFLPSTFSTEFSLLLTPNLQIEIRL